MKQCTKCGVEKLESEFYTDKRKTSGLREQCKPCVLLANSKRESRYTYTRKAYRKNHEVEIRAKHQKYYKENKEKIDNYNKEYRRKPSYYFLSYRKGAISRGLAFDFTEEEFLTLFWGKSCYYCNTIIETLGVDRIDPDKGYNKDNTTPCCTLCNVMKSSLKQEEFENQILKIYDNMIDHRKKFLE